MQNFYNKHTIFEKIQNDIYANVGIFRIFFLLPLINLEFFTIIFTFSAKLLPVLAYFFVIYLQNNY
jgi:hypothetical protein